MRLTDADYLEYTGQLLRFETPAASIPLNRTVHQDIFEVLPLLPDSFADLLFIDPPYNITKHYSENPFRRAGHEEYAAWYTSWFGPLMRTVKPGGSVYICCDWRTSAIVYDTARKYLKIRNRITWEREKGRGATKNWKNCTEDIFFCTVSDDYFFDLERVKIQRRVIAPYRESNGEPRDWLEQNGEKIRLTHPSNFWTDITVPFWSMPENTDHPTQKPEKLLARVILASTRPGELVFDPFLGSGTSSVVAKKLGRNYLGIEKELEYCCLAEKRLARAAVEPRIQGYNGVFQDRNL